MLDEREIDIEIARLEYTESSYPNYAKLANLYTIKNQMHREDGANYNMGYSLAAAPEEPTAGDYGNSDFLRAVSGKDNAAAWAVMDELMDTLSIVNAKVYDRVMEKMRNI